MIQGAYAARGDHRNRHGIGDGASKWQVEASLGAVAVHGCEQDFAGAERHDLLSVFNRIDARRLAPAMGEDFKPG